MNWKSTNMSADLVEKCIRFAERWAETRWAENQRDDTTISPTTIVSTATSAPGFGGTPASTTSFEPDPHAVSQAEALSYYAGLPSEPLLIYRTGKPWSPPRGPEAQRRTKELRPVFNHPIVDLWRAGLGDKVVEVMDTHQVFFTSIDVVRFKTVEVDEALSDEEDDEALSDKEDDGEEDVKGEPAVGPVTIWVGVYVDHTSPSLAHKAAQDVLALLLQYKLTDIDVDFRGSVVTRKAGPQLLSPVGDLNRLVDVVSPLTPALGLRISTMARPNAQGTMALYLNDGDGNLLGLTCRHVLIGSEVGNLDYKYHPHVPAKNVVLLGKKAYTELTDSIKVRIARHGILVRRWRKQIERFVEREKGSDELDAAKAARERVETQALVDKAEEAIKALGKLLHDVETRWKKPKDRVLGPIIRAPAIRLGVGEERFTEDWCVFRVDKSKLGDGYRGNKMDLGTEMSVDDFTLKCFPHGDADRQFEYPVDRLLPLQGTLTDELMRHPDMWDSAGEPCLLVVKSGNATGTTIGHANGVFSIVRDYFAYDMASVFSEPGDSGSIIADIRGRIGGMLTGGAGTTKSPDMTYATPFWWLLKRIQNNGLPKANLNVVGN
ncbi:hypothetical protein FRC11_004642 [Ceratobasidium sp. 423]|nr:hypothetical protein FRC11_004642 [Ceratobasidium sp. 423]